MKPAVFIDKKCPEEWQPRLAKMAKIYEQLLDVFCLPAGTQLYVKFWDTTEYRQQVDLERAQYDRFTIEVSPISLNASASDMRSTARHELTHILLYPCLGTLKQLLDERYGELSDELEETVVTRVERTMAAMCKDMSGALGPYDYESFEPLE